MKKWYRLLGLLLLPLSLAIGCASPGDPDGGPYDETAPSVIGSSPEFGQLNAKPNKISIFFNEFVRIENASEKVVVSPPQLEMPEFSSSGKKITIKLQDSLKTNTTYTIDFSDAIVDNNEGNPLGNYAFVFSTGDTADTMEVSGHVLNAQNLEPIKGILVGLHSDTTDTVFQKQPFVRVARTNGSGEFRIKGVAPGKYRAYALQDMDGNFAFSQKSEMLAFSKKVFETGCYPDVRYDTIWHDSIYYDSIRTIPYTHFIPDDLVLLAYTESHQERHLLKTERATSEHFDIYFTAPCDKLPQLKGINFDEKDAFVLNHSAGYDTLQYWIKDTLLIYQDTLEAELTYLETDTLGKLVEKTDTQLFVSKFSHEKQVKWQADARKKWEKEQERLKKKNMPYQKEMPEPPLDFRMVTAQAIAPDENLLFESKEPIKTIDTTRIHLVLKQDSNYVEAPFILKRHQLSVFHCTLYAEWRPQQEYQLILDSAAFVGIYGHTNRIFKQNIRIPSLDTYGSLFLNLPGISDTTAVVELLTAGDKPYRTVRSKDGKAEFYFVKPGRYFLRLFMDRNGNGKWDPGEYETGTPPEDTYYYPNELNLRALWDLEQTWDINATSREKQKPLVITKQKPDKEKSIRHRNAERERNKRAR